MSLPDPLAAVAARSARVQAAMARHGVGALLLATPHLAAFASGARRVQVAGSGGVVPWVVLRAGTASATVFTPDPDGAPPGTTAEPLCWDRARQLARLRTLVAGSGGALAGDVFSPALRSLASDLGRPLIDAAPLLAEASAPKSADEVGLIAQALAGARAGVRAALGASTLQDARARAAETMGAAGAGFPLAELLAWRAGARLDPVTTLAPGDAVEVGMYVAGHAGLAGDTVAADDAARRRWSAALCALAKACRAGESTAAIRAAARDAGATQIGFLAHGIGVGLEPPRIDLDAAADLPLVAGTVLMLAPVVDGVRATRALLVHDGAPRWLEPAP